MPRSRRAKLRALLLVGASVGAMSLPSAAPASASETAALSPTAGGWAVVGDNDAVIFEATGPDARRRCLERARELGVLRIATRY
jgi:hypothetical protein